MSKKHQDWAEKYRPKRLKRVVGNEDIMRDMKRFVRNLNFPNMLFMGTPGVGKSTTAKLLCRAIGVPFLEINSSRDSGINVIRDEVTDYAWQMDITGSEFKVIIFDQVDRMTTAAQQASLQLTEEVSDYCRFIATSNNVRGLHHAFMDRFKVYRFMPIDAPDIVKRLQYICMKEHIKAKSEDLYYIAKASRGSVRAAVKTLQAAAEGKSGLDKADVQAWTWVPPYAKIRKCLRTAMDGKFKKAVGLADDILLKTQPKWFFTGITDQIFKGKRFSDEQVMAICSYLPQGNPHVLFDMDVYRFLGEIAREFGDE